MPGPMKPPALGTIADTVDYYGLFHLTLKWGGAMELLASVLLTTLLLLFATKYIHLWIMNRKMNRT